MQHFIYPAPKSSSLSSLDPNSEGITTKSVIYGEHKSGKYSKASMTSENLLEVALQSPRGQYGSVMSESLTPVFQADCVYGINPTMSYTTTGINGAGTTSATVTGTNNVFKCSTGTTALSFSSLQSRKRLMI